MLEIKTLTDKLHLLYGSKGLLDSFSKLEILVKSLNESSQTAQTFLDDILVYMRRKTMDMSKLTSPAIRGRPDRGEISVPVVLAVRAQDRFVVLR